MSLYSYKLWNTSKIIIYLNTDEYADGMRQKREFKIKEERADICGNDIFLLQGIKTQETLAASSFSWTPEELGTKFLKSGCQPHVLINYPGALLHTQKLTLTINKLLKKKNQHFVTLKKLCCNLKANKNTKQIQGP